jgi:hypothetical protein
MPAIEDECKNRLARASLAQIQNEESEGFLTQLVEISNLGINETREELYQASFCKLLFY